MEVVLQGDQSGGLAAQLGVGGEGVGDVDVSVLKGLILQADVDVGDGLELQGVGLAQGGEPVSPLDIVRVAAEVQLPRQVGQVAGGF